MEGLLLGALSYLGKSSNLNTNTNNKEQLENVYSSNMENNMNLIDQKQANTQNKGPEYFQQFDSLSFDNLGKPTPENQSYFTRSGFNKFLQRDIDFQNGYSEFAKDNEMHYGVVTKEEFTHNNMTPFTSRRDIQYDVNANSRKYENLSGNDTNWKHKTEVEQFFTPTQNMSWVNGAPAVSGELSNRYIASFKNNYGNMPFQTETRVLPGVDGKVSAPYAVHRVNPRNIDELRSEINKKETYTNKPLETIKKGEVRAMDFNISKFKIPTFREITTNDLVGNSAVNQGPKVTQNFLYVDSQRGENETVQMGPAYNNNQAVNAGIDSFTFSEPKKENYQNDFTHAINAVNSRPVFTNKISYTAYENQRNSTNYNGPSTGAYDSNMGSYFFDKNNLPKNTIKETTLDNINLGANGNYEKKNYVFSKDNILPITNRQTTSHDTILNPTTTFQNTHVTYNDMAKQTIKETTINKQYNSNINVPFQNINNTITDTIKPTIKQSTIIHQYNTNVNTPFQNINNTPTDSAKPTNKQYTIDNSYISNTAPTTKANNVINFDQAKPTIRESTEDNNYIGICSTNDKMTYTSYGDNAKTTIKESTLIPVPTQNIVANVPSIYSKNDEIARTTIKQTILHSDPMGRAHDANQSSYMIDRNDTARVTIKESSLLTDYNGGATYNVKALKIGEAEYNMTIDDKRQVTAMSSRTSNAKSDQIRGDIVKENVQFNDKKTLYSYVSNPSVGLDYSVTPMHKNITDKKTDLNSNNFYKIDPIFIQTLHDNPLVNDIMHPKNII
jgi:hypothetical protein